MNHYCFQSPIQSIDPNSSHFRHCLLRIEQQLDCRSAHITPIHEILNYTHLRSCGFNRAEIEGCNKGSELANCAAFILIKSEDYNVLFNPRVGRLLLATALS